MIVLPDAEDRTIVSRHALPHLDKTLECDGQTDLPWLLHRSALWAMLTTSIILPASYKLWNNVDLRMYDDC